MLSIEPGPRVEITFEGDALERADRERLVPIAREHSVDEDLLEDSKFGIERHFREQGYCNPLADYRRTEADGVLRVTFSVTHGPRCVVESAEVTGNATLTSAELAPLVLTRAGELFSESTLSSDALRIQGYYRQRGFSAVKVTSQVERREPKAGSEFVRVRLVVAEGVQSVLETVRFEGNTSAMPRPCAGARLRLRPDNPTSSRRSPPTPTAWRCLSEPRLPRGDRRANAEGGR